MKSTCSTCGTFWKTWLSIYDVNPKRRALGTIPAGIHRYAKNGVGVDAEMLCAWEGLAGVYGPSVDGNPRVELRALDRLSKTPSDQTREIIKMVDDALELLNHVFAALQTLRDRLDEETMDDQDRPRNP